MSTRRAFEELAAAAREVLDEADRTLASGGEPRQRFRDALEQLRKLTPPAPPPPPSKRASIAPLSQDEWTQLVHAWALGLPKGARVTPEAALTAVGIGTEATPVEINAVGRALSRLPADEFSSSWFPSGATLAQVWIRQ